MGETVDILIFGPELPVVGKPATCDISSTHLSIPSLKQTIDLGQLKAEVGGFDHDQLQLHWVCKDTNYMMVPTDKAGQKLLNQYLARQQVPGQRHWKLATTAQSLVWKSLWYGFATLMLLVVIGIWQYDRLLTIATNRISVETETKMGQAVLKSYDKGNRLEKGAAVDFVQSLGLTLAAGSQYDYQWLVVKDPTVNAFALPGGIVIVNTGLLEKADSANEVAAVLAHEVQHVEQKHALKNMINSAGIAAVVLLVLGDANAALIIIAHQVSQQYFSRQVEAEADEKGRKLLLSKKIKAEGMATFFEKLGGNDADNGALEWLSSHPDTKHRIALSKAFVKAHPCDDCVTLTWDKLAILKNIAN